MNMHDHGRRVAASNIIEIKFQFIFIISCEKYLKYQANGVFKEVIHRKINVLQSKKALPRYFFCEESSKNSRTPTKARIIAAYIFETLRYDVTIFFYFLSGVRVSEKEND